MQKHTLDDYINQIWSISERLRGFFKALEYSRVLLSMTVLRRLDALRDSSLSTLTSAKEVMDLINGYDPEIVEMFSGFRVADTLKTLEDYGILCAIIQSFAKVDLNHITVSRGDMGLILDEVARKCFEGAKVDNGEFYTTPDVAELLARVLFEGDKEMLKEDATRTIYDPACGTGGMLCVAEKALMQYKDSKANLLFYGQELNDETFAICRAHMLVKGMDIANVKRGNTLSDDRFIDQTFDFIIANPPFGVEWKDEKDAVEQESLKGFNGRFGAGLPPVNDGQMLFLQTVISKMTEPPKGSRIAIIHNGSPLFTGDAGTGPSEIRRHIIENDLLEAIIALPSDIFYNTGIPSYIWVISNKKQEKRKGKTQLIDASQIFTKMRKSLGEKRNEISKEQIQEIVETYGNFEESPISKIFDNKEFGYQRIVIERPKRDENGEIVMKRGKPQADPDLRETEIIGIDVIPQEWFKENISQDNPEAWIDTSKTKIGYEIPFTRHFYKYEAPRASKDIYQEILEIQDEIERLMLDIAS